MNWPRTCLLIALAADAATSSQPRLPLHSCEIAVGVAARCGTFSVYENRVAKAGRKIDLNIVMIPAAGPDAAGDPVFWLEGGPGGAATQAIGPVTQQYFKGIRADHDLVFIDQRGTGQSNPLKCDDIGETPANIDRYFGPLFPIESIRACRQKLEKIADLTQYSTAIAADDLDDVRAALGYERINLAGASYGTLTALVYIRRHPSHVRSAFLIGTVPPDFRLPLPFAKASQNAWQKLVADCAVDAGCRDAFPNLQDEFDAVLARFEAEK